MKEIEAAPKINSALLQALQSPEYFVFGEIYNLHKNYLFEVHTTTDATARRMLTTTITKSVISTSMPRISVQTGPKIELRMR